MVFEYPYTFIHVFSFTEKMILSPSFQERIRDELKKVGVELSEDEVFKMILQMYKMHHKIRVASNGRNYEFLHALGNNIDILELKELEQIKADVDPKDSVFDFIGWRILNVVRMFLEFERMVYDDMFWDIGKWISNE